jgi:hypothetical protein
LLEFVPRSFKLRLSTLVIIAIHPCVLDENVEAMDEGSC